MATAMALTAASAAKAQYKPLKLPSLDESTTSTGMRIVVAQRGPLPLVTIRFVVQAGSAVDPAGKHGLADFTARLLRRGTAKMTADQINEAVEFVGGSLGVGASEDYTSVFISAPAEHLDAMMSVLGQIVREPTFPPEEVESARRRVLAQIANDLDDPGELAERALLRAVFGNHPYGHEVIGATSHIKKFTRDDCVKFHKQFFGPKVSTLVVVGDVEPSKVLAAAEKAFAGFSGGPAAVPEIPALGQIFQPGDVVIVDKADQTQTQVRIGAAGVAKGHPSYFPIAAFNTVLGGGFTSRLVTEIRVKRGLSYGASSHFGAMKAAGMFEFTSFTKTESTREILDVTLKELARMKEKGPSAAELKSAQNYVAGIYPSRVETNDALSGALTEVLIYGLPKDWISRFRDRVREVTPAAAAQAAKAHLPEQRVIVLVGNAAEIEKQVKDLGTIRKVAVADLE